MSKKMAVVLIGYGAALAVLSVLLKQRGSETGTFLIAAGLAGAAFCAGWGAVSVASPRGRTWPVLVLIALAFAFLAQSVDGWSNSLGKVDGDVVTPVLLSLGFLLTVGMLAYLLYAERPASMWTGRSNPTALDRSRTR
jgi:hypothetical protein